LSFTQSPVALTGGMHFRCHAAVVAVTLQFSGFHRPAARGAVDAFSRMGLRRPKGGTVSSIGVVSRVRRGANGVTWASSPFKPGPGFWGVAANVNSPRGSDRDHSVQALGSHRAGTFWSSGRATGEPEPCHHSVAARHYAGK
jgi:hypothetical protein